MALRTGYSANGVTRFQPDLKVSCRGTRSCKLKEVNAMLYTIAVVLLILWLLGLVSSYTIGGFIHVLLVIAIVVVLLRVIGGRNPV
jgi:hypothetical protein